MNSLKNAAQGRTSGHLNPTHAKDIPDADIDYLTAHFADRQTIKRHPGVNDRETDLHSITRDTITLSDAARQLDAMCPVRPTPLAMHAAPVWDPPWSTISGVAAYGWLIAAIGAHYLGMQISCVVCVGISVLLGAYAYRWRRSASI